MTNSALHILNSGHTFGKIDELMKKIDCAIKSVSYIGQTLGGGLDSMVLISAAKSRLMSSGR
jgi:hypothetical protein